MDFCPSVFIFEFEQVFFNLACINLFKVNNRNTTTQCDSGILQKTIPVVLSLTWNISQLFLVFLLLTLNKWMLTGRVGLFCKMIKIFEKEIADFSH